MNKLKISKYLRKMLAKHLELKPQHLNIKQDNSKLKIWNRKDLNLW